MKSNNCLERDVDTGDIGVPFQTHKLGLNSQIAYLSVNMPLELQRAWGPGLFVYIDISKT